MESLTREHFNRWYKLGPYFLSVLVVEVPIQVSEIKITKTTHDLICFGSSF